MREPNPRTSRLAIAGGVAAAIIVGGAGFFVGRTTSPRPPAVPVKAPPPAPPPTPIAVPPRVLDRAGLAGLAAGASDSQASGTPLPAEVASAAGRRFELVLPFGCDGPASADSRAPLRWRYEPENETLRIHAAPILWQGGDWGLGDAQGLTIRGFWISRPWSSSERCPQGNGRAVATDAQPVTLPGQTLALASFVAADARREENRDEERPYETVQRIAPDRFDPAQGFRLRVLGRIDRVPGGEPIRCVQPAGSEQRPICVIAAVIDEVRIENPLDGQSLATWGPPRTTRDGD